MSGEAEMVVGVGGMTCGHCEASVQDALARLPGVIGVTADREEGTARVRHAGALEVAVVSAAVDGLGFEFLGLR